ncbi:MAG: chromosome partitioning protein ParA [Candidatus Buchananbacteria bacterium RIFCSPHIGHO2_01_FULL_47_11b]|uniref:Chromosome partitioning protein ParA n=1 Tax=Candidatus Buchananbacteria bacterium RIFCSPHIGHO2_01_FULL_47_11b TaxID=1797537 RepID=A0A1G1Y634_9BACT|nr:MAG: chromosome partitioning protein ParA [Candidatus Buchananbacteria bacterium RIFCSPHIGHO2_01_FULL_47_11b]
MSRIIAIVNQKGGVGKTTTAINLGAYLAWFGNFVLLVDLDPQANATSALGVRLEPDKQSLYHALTGAAPSFRDIIVGTSHQGYKLAPTTADLAGARVELIGMENREFRLRDALLEVRNDYDYIIIDNPPSLDLLTVNGLAAADDILIPVQAEYLALEGLGQLLSTIELVRDNLRPELGILGAVLTMYDKRNRLSDQVASELKQHFPYKVFEPAIPRNVRLTESPSYGQSILAYDAGSKGAKAYEQLARSIIEHYAYTPTTYGQ